MHSIDTGCPPGWLCYPGDTIIQRVAIAVCLTDSGTGLPTIGPIQVGVSGTDGAIGEGMQKAVNNLGVHYIFTNLPEGTYSLTVRGQYYVPLDRVVEVSSLSPVPVIPILLTPR